MLSISIFILRELRHRKFDGGSMTNFTLELSEIKFLKFHNVVDQWNINKNQRIKKNLKIFIGYLLGFEHTLVNDLFKVAEFKLPLK